ncbi:hypothetical protein [Streptomyces caniscabiei]|uniref:hypothetical protein n=1 Tax=Streptomyces caniscabiei TaxID=2746961 RepID=UPI000765A181|nr:hypothetical protein [Streptomyces caniscabiei]
MTTEPTAETARSLLWRHGLPEDVLDGALALHAQELAGKIRAHRDSTRGAVQATKVMDFAADLIWPERGATPGPVCKFEEGCHRVVPCEPGCGASVVRVVALLRRAEAYLSALHGSVALHDNLAANLGCAGCELRDKLRTALAADAPTPWIEGDPLMEAIAAAVWEHCARDDDDMPQLVLDDPRTIAAAAASVARAVILTEAAECAYRIARRLDEQQHDQRAQGAWDVENVFRAELRSLAAEAQPTTKPETEPTPEDPARIDQLRPEFFEHASVESIDFQIQRARRQQGNWGNRERTLGILRRARVLQKDNGEWPAAGVRQDGAQPS